MTIRIGLFGLFGSGNFGNDGSLEAVIGQLSDIVPDARLTVICDGPDAARDKYNIEAVEMAVPYSYAPKSSLTKLAETAFASLRDSVRALRVSSRLDAIVMPGTGLLDDFNSSPRGIPLNLWIWCAAAYLTRTPVHFVSIGAGPIVNPWSRKLMISAARLAATRSYRDQGSKTFLARHGVDTRNDPVYPDIAFALPCAPAPDGDHSTLTVGLGLMTYRGWNNNASDSAAAYDRYLAELTTFAQGLLTSGYRLRLIVGDACDRDTVHRFQAMLETSSNKDKIVVDDADSLQDVLKQMTDCDIIVATRFHNVVCALKAGRPVVSVGYAEKNRLLLEKAGLDAYAVRIDSFTASDLRQRFDRAIAAKPVIESRLAAFEAQSQMLLHQQSAQLCALLSAPDGNFTAQSFVAKTAGRSDLKA